jgi:hypothetical protein
MKTENTKKEEGLTGKMTMMTMTVENKMNCGKGGQRAEKLRRTVRTRNMFVF